MAVVTERPSRAFQSFAFDVIYRTSNKKNWNSVKENLHRFWKMEKWQFHFEPIIQGAGGMQTYSPTHFDELMIKLAHKKIFCIADEIMMVLAELIIFLLPNICKKSPILICSSKGLCGGFYLSSYTSVRKKEVAQPCTDNDILKTFSFDILIQEIQLFVLQNASLEILLRMSVFKIENELQKKTHS
jgi:adenosylmethionine-8-amino-7-oxononanoate aminotransferase